MSEEPCPFWQPTRRIGSLRRANGSIGGSAARPFFERCAGIFGPPFSAGAPLVFPVGAWRSSLTGSVNSLEACSRAQGSRGTSTSELSNAPGHRERRMSAGAAPAQVPAVVAALQNTRRTAGRTADPRPAPDSGHPRACATIDRPGVEKRMTTAHRCPATCIANPIQRRTSREIHFPLPSLSRGVDS